jgi:hypothetical protein
MSNETYRKPDVIIKEFNTNVRSLITRLERKSRSDFEIANLDRLKKRISLLKQSMGESALISESKEFFLEYASTILDRSKCEELFLTVDVRAEYIKRKGKVDKQDEFMFTLTDSIRSHYKKSP